MVSTLINSDQSEHLKSLHYLIKIVDSMDPYTGRHLWRVSQFSRLLALDLGMNRDESLQVCLGGFLHDVGKISVPNAILVKPGKLTDRECAIIKTHPKIGADIIKEHPLAGWVIEAIRDHHERPDGKGYPRGISGVEVSLVARIVGLCDAFDAMTSNRPYRKAMPLEKAHFILRRMAGSQFDKHLVQKFIQLSNKNIFTDIIGLEAYDMPLTLCSNCGPIVPVKGVPVKNVPVKNVPVKSVSIIRSSTKNSPNKNPSAPSATMHINTMGQIEANNPHDDKGVHCPICGKVVLLPVAVNSRYNESPVQGRGRPFTAAAESSAGRD